LPINFFTHRFHEAITYNSTIIPHNYPLYQNQKANISGYGDLCFNTKYEIPKDESYITDELGFRNDKFIKNPDILIIGDSYTLGATINQSQLLANQIMKNSNYSVYGMAPIEFSSLDKMLKLNIIQKPKYIIYERVERGEIPKIEYFDNSFSNQLEYKYYNLWSFGNINVFLDKIFRAYVNNYVKAKVTNSRGTGTQSKIEEKLFFYDTKHLNPSIEWMNYNIKSLESYKKYCDSIGSKFIYLPMPNKETVYFDKVPLEKQPDYLLRLGNVLKKKNIDYYPTIEFYNNFRKKDSRMLYQYDDSHWNALASEMIAKEILIKLNKQRK
jgi:alginate O-acetyltransferase complex protein AlgJ